MAGLLRANALTSSPLSTAPSSQDIHRTTAVELRQNYRETRELPFELVQHVQIYFEEAMFMQAFRLLLSITSADASSTSTRPITIPPPSHLSLTATLATHPAFTTRTTSREKWDQANSALRLLRLLNKIAGPINAGFNEAFIFTRYDVRSSRVIRRPDGGDSVDDGEERGDRIDISYAEADSLWIRAEDFWAMIGWAFNCSCLSGMYAARWEHWCTWLEFMLEVLESDWQLHHSKDTCEQSLIWQYIKLAPGGNTRARRIMRAIFADGSSRSLNEFREVFRKELKEPVKESDKIKKREVDVNIENEIYGDYMAKDDSDTSADEDQAVMTTSLNPRLRKQFRTSRRTATPKSSSQSLYADTQYPNSENTSTHQTLGPPGSITLRLRFLDLLSQTSCHETLTSSSTSPLPNPESLYTLYVEFIKPLPLPIFQSLLSPTLHDKALSPDSHATLLEFILQRTIEIPTNASTDAHSEEFLTQAKLTDRYLPFGASKGGGDANCRVSILLEAMMRLMSERGLLRRADGLKAAVDRGVERRIERARGKAEDGRRRGGGAGSAGNSGSGGRIGNGNGSGNGGLNGEEEAWEWLVESGERIKGIFDGLEA